MADVGGDQRLISTDKAAHYLGITARRLREHHREWGIPAVRLGPRTLMFRVSALDKYTAERTIKPKAGA
jgi:excisionase family DNA binding protein